MQRFSESVGRPPIALLIVNLLWAGSGVSAQESAADRDYNIAIAGYNFDPLDMSRALPERRMLGPSALERLEREPGYFIVQLAEPLTAETREELSARAGLDLDEYIPNLAYVERLSPEERARLAQDPAIRAVVPFPPAFKLSPTIGSFEPRTEERAAIEGLYLRAILFDEAEPRAAADTLRAAGARGIEVRDDRDIGGVARIHFTLDRTADLDAVAAISEIRWIEEIGELIEDNVNAATTIQSGTPGTAPTWNAGLTGRGQIIGIIDTAPPDINHCFFQDPVDNTPGLSHRKIIDVRNGSGLLPGGHGTFTAGSAAGDDFNNPATAARRGGAYDARLVAGTTADVTNNTLLAELTAAAGMGAVIHTNSWHDNTARRGDPATYNQNAADVDNFTFNNEDHLVFGSMGNDDEEQGPPGTAKNAVGVNAAMADPNDNTIGDGNPGPTADGRRKPDVVAVGCDIQSAVNDTACTTGSRDTCATSYATPHAAAAGAQIRQYFTDGYYPTGAADPNRSFVPTGALIKAVLTNSGANMTGPAGYPSTEEGWGIIRLDDGLFFPGDQRNMCVWDVRHVDGLATGVTRNFTVNVEEPAEPLKVAMVFSDAPGAAGAATPTVNDLDLRVISPNGAQTFRGNVFNAGASATGGAADTINTVEMVLVNNPAVGEWTIAIDGTNVAVGDPGQGFAIAATGHLTMPCDPLRFLPAVLSVILD